MSASRHRIPRGDNIKHARSKAAGISPEFALKSFEESQRLSHIHQGHEMNEIKTTVFQSQNCSFIEIALNLQALQETNVPLWFMTVEHSFGLKCVNDGKRKYEFSLGAVELRQLELIR